MNRDELLNQTKRILAKVEQNSAINTFVEACEFLRKYAGANSTFLETLKRYQAAAMNNKQSANDAMIEILNSFHDYVESGLLQEISPERQAQLDVVSDYLEMANTLLENNTVHPAAPAVLIGATLEEFLRTWIEDQSLSLGTRKPGLETYSQVLREANLITKQDGKDITSWAGVRNHAAHGEWDEVSDRNRISLMLEGVNLFMRKYS
jgi:hypothetical protein